MQNYYTTKGKHLTIDSRRLIERWKKEMNYEDIL
ncbi:transposase-like protein%2C IS1239 [Streptococcus pneumoniae]|nr:transposase-like protein%2C IS1239 [Streptococcus pneumoniae]CKI43801.1 transposase-like protein%2C IS1239 [Streptococcus pneumoniae]CKI76704.1 transposase-like protein%2C IS1239 [Streptococcus pneumoniae]CKJ42298.1 transposase-like protein%2C IS1239 [Streptococcus pneumoniae]